MLGQASKGGVERKLHVLFRFKQPRTSEELILGAYEATGMVVLDYEPLRCMRWVDVCKRSYIARCVTVAIVILLAVTWVLSIFRWQVSQDAGELAELRK